MGKSRHERKSDKETQSPMLKIFKEIMRREKAPAEDLENGSLLKDKKKKKKRKLSHSSSKKREQDDSSANEDPGPRIILYDGQNKDRVTSVHQVEATVDRARKKPFKIKSKLSKEKPGEKSPKDPDDTFSCVSCALKKIASNEYVCIGALAVIFTISVVFAFCALFNTLPVIDKKAEQDTARDAKYGLDSDMLRKRIDRISDGVKDSSKLERRSDRSAWDEKVPRNLKFLSRRTGNEISDINLESMNTLRSRALTDELSKVLENSNLHAVTDNARIRDFYKKLLYTDTKIKRLKRMASNKSVYDRQKRSIFHGSRRFRTTKQLKSENSSTADGYERTEINKYKIAVERVRGKNNGRRRRSGYASTSQAPSGIIFEKKKVTVEFIKDDDIKFPKCSHVNRVHDFHSNHYVQHTEKFDEILDKLLDQKIPNAMTETPKESVKRIETQTSQLNENKENREETTTQRNIHSSATRPKDKVITIPSKSTSYANGPLNFIHETTANMYEYYIKPAMNKAKSRIKAKILKMLNSPPSSTTQMTAMTMTTKTPITEPNMSEKYNLDLIRKPAYKPYSNERKASTNYMPGSPSEKRVTKLTSNEILSRFPIRKLMQADEVEEEAVGYEDPKEVMSDDMQTHDETDKSVDNKNRGVDQNIAHPQLLHLIPQSSITDPDSIPMKPAALDVHNPNWKGPMPLYQDEINTMIKNTDIHNTNNIALPLNTKDISSELGMAESEFNDVQYVEDYLSSKYDKIVKMAQAYSDYGVLSPKKDELRFENFDIPNTKQDNRVQMLSNDSFYNIDETLLKRSKENVGAVNSRSNSVLIRDYNPLKVMAKYFKTSKDKHNIRKTTKKSEIEQISSKSTHKVKKEDFMIFNTREKRAENSITQNMKLNADDSSSLLVEDREIVNSYKKIPRRSLKSVYLDEDSEEVVKTDYYNATTNGTIFTTGVSGTSDNLSDVDFAGDNTYDYFSYIDVSPVPKNKSSVKFLDFKNGNFNEIYKVLLTTNGSDILYDDYQDTYPELIYTDVIMAFPTNMAKVTDNSTKNDTNHIGLIFEINLNKMKELLNKTAILDNLKIPDIKIKMVQKDVVDKLGNPINKVNCTKPFSNSTGKSQEKSFQDSNIRRPISEKYNNSIGKENNYNQNGTIASKKDPSINLLSIMLKEQNKTFDDYVASSYLYNKKNDVIISTNDTMISLILFFFKELTKSLDVYVANPKLTTSTEATNKYQENNNVLPEDSVVNNTRKKRFNDNDYPYNFMNITEIKNNKSSDNSPKNNGTKQNITNLDPSDFFLMASNFFSSLAGIFFEKGIEKDPLLNLVALLTVTNNTNSSMINTTSKNKTKMNKENIEYSLYDSEMVDNIGHRSRVLLSFEEKSNVTNNKTERSEDIAISRNSESIDVFTTESELHYPKDNITGLSTQTYVTHNSTLKTKEKDKITPEKNEGDKNNLKANKSLVKRSAPEDSNLIFWHDIYDEEYGIQTDPLENTVRDKNYLPANELMKRSGVWLQDKMKRIGESIKKQSRGGLEKIYGVNNKMRKGRVSRGLDMFFKKREAQKNKYPNFDSELFKEKNNSRRNSLSELTDHMKVVCEEAAKAVQMRQSIKADATIADSQKSDEVLSVNLMQNLVRLLSDLVDYQVELKTCNKLPEDLHQFLIWLKVPVMDSKDEKVVMNEESSARILDTLSQTEANPAASNPQPRLHAVQIRQTSKVSSRKSMLPTPSQAWPMETEDNIQPEERAEYIGALHAVKDLLRQYEMMSVEDKKKMAGVKDYLENQLFYLSRQLHPNEYSYSHLYSQNPNLYRLKRDSSTKSKRHVPYYPRRRSYRKRRHNQSIYKLRGRPNKFVKSFGKKHTRTTAGNYDNIESTAEVKKQYINKDRNVDEGEGHVKRGVGINKKDTDDNKERCAGIKKEDVENNKENKVPNERSIMNVYYHAVEEAKKSTTIKNDMNINLHN